MEDDQQGTLPEMIFWERADGRLKIIRHCDNIFSLLLDDIDVLPSSNFQRICSYAWSEFNLM